MSSGPVIVIGLNPKCSINYGDLMATPGREKAWLYRLFWSTNGVHQIGK
jgi:hypothetical protein